MRFIYIFDLSHKLNNTCHRASIHILSIKCNEDLEFVEFDCKKPHINATSERHIRLQLAFSFQKLTRIQKGV